MKLIFKVILFMAATSLTLTAVASEKSRNGHGTGHERILIYTRYITGQNGTQGSNNIIASEYCNENPDGMGGTRVQGAFEISGFIAGSEVSEFELHTTLDACPNTFTSTGDGGTQSVTISAGNYKVIAVCTGQTVDRFSGKGQIRYAGQGKRDRYSRENQTYYTPDPSNGSCVVTATDSDGNTLETFGNKEISGSDASAFVADDYQYNQ